MRVGLRRVNPPLGEPTVAKATTKTSLSATEQPSRDSQSRGKCRQGDDDTVAFSDRRDPQSGYSGETRSIIPS